MSHVFSKRILAAVPGPRRRSQTNGRDDDCSLSNHVSDHCHPIDDTAESTNGECLHASVRPHLCVTLLSSERCSADVFIAAFVTFISTCVRHGYLGRWVACASNGIAYRPNYQNVRVALPPYAPFSVIIRLLTVANELCVSGA